MLPEKLTVECIASTSLRQLRSPNRKPSRIDRKQPITAASVVRHHAEIEPAERAGDQHHERRDVGERADHLVRVARALLLRRDARHELGVHADIEHEQRRHDQARDHAGDEQLRHRGLGEGAVDDHREARRDQDAERAAGRERAGRERAMVVAAGQLRQRDAADRGRGGDARAAHRGEDRAARDVGLQQPAGQRRHQLGEAVVDAVGEAADAAGCRP